MPQYHIAWMPGDGVGNDVMEAAKFILDALKFDARYTHADIGWDSQKGDIIVAGRNFGTGSSREQAATCLALRGIQLVIAASFSETYARNAYNNGFILIDCPAFSDDLRASLADRKGATIAGPHVEIDFRRSQITCDGKSFPFPPPQPDGSGTHRRRRRGECGQEATEYSVLGSVPGIDRLRI
ncbi:MAG: hypothetical protein IT430_00495 [Phycisphaerales bacterium]|nr:hypothetical protein [Phycisphaerales bacterium]